MTKIECKVLKSTSLHESTPGPYQYGQVTGRSEFPSVDGKSFSVDGTTSGTNLHGVRCTGQDSPS